MKRRWLVCSVVLLSFVLALPASTQTHSPLVNGGFEVDTSGWSEWWGTLTRTTTTVHSGSGAAQVVTDFIGAGRVYQCIDLSPYLGTWPTDGGTQYLTLNGYLYSDGVLPLSLRYRFSADTTCAGSEYGAGSGTSQTTAASWELHTITAAIPAGAQSVEVEFRADGFMTSGTFYADDLEAFSSSTTAVQSQGMAARNSLWAVGMVGVAAVGVVLGRRRRA
ncbi:MAG: hypothetical protein JXR84_26475 [Anaerolineae bacterium]|nr:hypothetical protein [Anaerolineae bacterium]